MTEENKEVVEYGVTETKEAMAMFAGFVKVAELAMADGKVNIEDLGHLMVAVPSIGPGVDGISKVAAELGDLTEDEEKEVKAHIDEKFGEGLYQLIGEDILHDAIHFASAISKLRAKK